MGKYLGHATVLKTMSHPLLGRRMYVPCDFEYFKQAPGGKLPSTQNCLREFRDSKDGTIALEAYAGSGVLTLIYLDEGYTPLLIEQEKGLVKALKKNINRYALNPRGVQCFHADNMIILPGIASNSRGIGVIDLDSYTSCIPQIKEAARILTRGLLFISSGEIRTVCRFKNTAFIKKRYDIVFNGPWRNFPQDVIYKFARQVFAARGKKIELVHTFVWPTVCRLCIRVN